MHHLHSAHDPILVVLSILIAVLGSWTALDVLHRVRANTGATRLWWLAGAAAATGGSIWSMHFVAMLAYDLDLPIRYNTNLTALSLVLAIAATGLGFAAVGVPAAKPGPRRIAGAGAAMGIGICLMHYVGMAAMRLAATPTYDAALVVISGAIAVGASTLALVLALDNRSGFARAVGALALGLAITGMHYTGMAAVTFSTVLPAHPGGAFDIPSQALAIGVAACTLLLLALARPLRCLTAASISWRCVRRRPSAAARSGCVPSSIKCRLASLSPTRPPVGSSSQIPRRSSPWATGSAPCSTGMPMPGPSVRYTPTAGPWLPTSTRWLGQSSEASSWTESECFTSEVTGRSCTSKRAPLRCMAVTAG